MCETRRSSIHEGLQMKKRSAGERIVGTARAFRRLRATIDGGARTLRT